jgi:hypothetical protein
MPPEDSVRRHDSGHVRQHPTAEALAEDGEPPPFIVAQPYPASVQLRPEHTVLFPQEFDDIAPLAVHPAEQRRDEQVQRNHGRSLRQHSVDSILRHYGTRSSPITHEILISANGLPSSVESGCRATSGQLERFAAAAIPTWWLDH